MHGGVAGVAGSRSADGFITFPSGNSTVLGRFSMLTRTNTIGCMRRNNDSAGKMGSALFLRTNIMRRLRLQASRFCKWDSDGLDPKPNSKAIEFFVEVA